ncbi:unnamed protein product [Strongylus vulgaris]|uniref:Glucuronosyltransferase n=1 Tax=Strongylus vulgaris TaxID=40348 RepID=A0A3P7JQ41_STRVU|nr:unnamed protein product [Strongylus vulgaris]
MIPLCALFLTALLPSCSSAYKMALFVPGIANSQVLFSSRVAETLTKAGHDVTMIMINSLEDFEIKVKIMKEVKIYAVNASFGLTKRIMEERHSKVIYKDLSIWDTRFRENLKQATDFLTMACRSE